LRLRRRLSERDVKRRERLIKRYVRLGYSANRIQKELQKRGLGMRRQTLLARVREVKIKEYERLYGAKRLAVYGTVWGEGRRIELYGTGRQLYQAMLDVAVHPPKKRFVVCHAHDAPRHLDYLFRWDEHPIVETR